MDPDWRKDPEKRARIAKRLRMVQNALAESRPKTAEELKAENDSAQIMRGGLPVTWSGGGHTLRSNAVVAPSAHERGAFAQKPEHTCVECVHFDLEEGRKQIIKQKFGERLVLEQEWALRHIGAGLDHLALCGRSNGEMAVTSLSPACDGFRPNKGKVK